jgi:hypothetical protein
MRHCGNRAATVCLSIEAEAPSVIKRDLSSGEIAIVPVELPHEPMSVGIVTMSDRPLSAASITAHLLYSRGGCWTEKAATNGAAAATKSHARPKRG